MSFRWTTGASGVGGGGGAAFSELWLFRRLKGNLFSTLLVPVGGGGGRSSRTGGHGAVPSQETGLSAGELQDRDSFGVGQARCGGCRAGCHGRSRAGQMKGTEGRVPWQEWGQAPDGDMGPGAMAGAGPGTQRGCGVGCHHRSGVRHRQSVPWVQTPALPALRVRAGGAVGAHGDAPCPG